MGRQLTNQFIQDQFNGMTIDNQISSQRVAISRAEREIERLSAIREEQASKPWYHWDGVKFIHHGYYHSDGYRSHHACSDTYDSYEEFVYVIIEAIDPDSACSGVDDSDFIIVSPNGYSLKVEPDEIRNLPLIKEYFERKELQASLKKAEKEISELDQDILRITKEIVDTNKYTELHIRSLQDKQLAVTEDRNKLKAKLENNDSAKRLKDLNALLAPIDELLED